MATAPVRAITRALQAIADRRRRADLALGAIGAAFSAVSVALPFGRDQGLYYFVGREWLRHGEMPYRDAFEQKTPAIFLLHAIAITLFGEHMWSVRVLELGCVAALGLVCARLATPAHEPVPRGLWGLSLLAAAVSYFGFFDFWNTAQCEIWCTTAALASACAVTRMRRERQAALVGGLLAGVALLFKPPGAPLVALAGLALLARTLRTPERRIRRTALAGALFGAAAAAPIALVVAYFAARGALPDMIDVLFGANRYYVEHERGAQSAFDVAAHTHDAFRLWEPVSALLLWSLVAGAVAGFVRRDRVLRDRHLFAAAVCVAAFLGVLSQLKFYPYHWGLIVGPATLVAANVALDAVALLRARSASLGPVLVGANLLAAFALTGRAANMWLEEVTATAEWLTGRIDREQFTRAFTFGDFTPHDGEEVALWLRDHTDPRDEIAVRGFEPEIYAISRRRYGGRFFWTSFLTDPRRAYRRDEWLAQDREQLVARSPRWVVAIAWVHVGPDAPEYFAPLGYVVRREMDGYAIMEKADAVGAR
jgi:4-amino-4-deoxy-L-arabinose transferase-like glycosyltransferase